MSKRSAKSVAALFVSVLAGADLVTVTDLRAQAATADDCLTAPKGATPAGGHWYYRIDRATKRQCWYLREDGERASDKSTRATPPVSPPATSAAAAEPAEQPPRTITRKAISDARAEYISQQSRAEQSPAVNPEPQTTGAAASTLTVQDGKLGIGTNVLAPAPLATTRWLDSSGVNASSSPADIRTAAVADPPADQQQDAEPVQQPAVLQPAPAGITFAAADSSATKPTASLQMLLLVMAAALALAGITVSLVFRLGRIRARRAMRRQRRAMWDSAKANSVKANSVKAKRSSAPPTRSAPPMRSAPPAFHREEARTRRAEAAHHPRPQDARPRPQEARERQVTDMLARLARSAQR